MRKKFELIPAPVGTILKISIGARSDRPSSSRIYEVVSIKDPDPDDEEGIQKISLEPIDGKKPQIRLNLEPIDCTDGIPTLPSQARFPLYGITRVIESLPR